MKFSKFFFLLFLMLTSTLLFAVPVNDLITYEHDGDHCFKPYYEVTVKWTVPFGNWQVLSDSDVSITISGGDASKVTTTTSGKIIFDKTGSYSINTSVTYTDCSTGANRGTKQTISKSTKVVLVTLKEIILKSGPEYANVGGVVSSQIFEVEKSDSITLKLVTEPADIDLSFNWSITGFAQVGQGITFAPSTSASGQKDIYVKFDSCELYTFLGINDNASSKIEALTVTPSKTWAHCGSETIILTPSGKDNDWKNGFKKETNYIDYFRTKWDVPVGRGSVKRDNDIFIWTPPSDKIGEIEIVATFDDSFDPYSPRDEEPTSESKTKVKVGSFKVRVKCVVTADGNSIESSLDEDGTVTGNVESTNTGSLETHAKENISTFGGGGSELNQKDLKTLIEWTFLTEPTGAETSGSISADLTLQGDASFSGDVYDGDVFDNGVTISFKVVEITIGGSDQDEGISVSAANFKCDDGGFADLLASDPANNLTLKSSSYSTYFDFPPWKDAKTWSMPKSTINHKKRSAEKVTANFQFKSYSNAFDLENQSIFWGYDLINTIANNAVKDIKVYKSFKNVKYVNQ